MNQAHTDLPLTASWSECALWRGQHPKTRLSTKRAGKLGARATSKQNEDAALSPQPDHGDNRVRSGAGVGPCDGFVPWL